jgi:hypothetical protein
MMILSSGGQDHADPLYKNEHDNAEWIHAAGSIVKFTDRGRTPDRTLSRTFFVPWQMFPFCEPAGPGIWHIRGDLIPLIFSLRARKPTPPT